MKNKLLLMFLAIGGLSIGAYTYSKTSNTTSPAVAGLSRTISNMVELDPQNQVFVEKAIDRALTIKETNKSTTLKFDDEIGPVGKVKVD
jgi:hypothetical protein